MKQALKRIARSGMPGALIAASLHRSVPRPGRIAAFSALLGYWGVIYARYRRGAVAQTRREREWLARTSWEAFWRHYNERVPTVEEELELWGSDYHQHRHEMRYDLVADAARRHVPQGGRILDVGCGSALVAERLLDLDAHYVGLDFGGHHIEFATKKFADLPSRLRTSFVRSDGENTPIADASVDVVVMSEVIEHLLRPELAVWEVARVLRPGGVYVMTTNNASEVPLRSPLSNLYAWVEKAIGADHPQLISLRPWVWPQPVDRAILPDGSPDVYVPHTHHIAGETRALFAAAGLETFHWSSFEFPPPQSASAQWLDRRGEPGKRAVDAIEWLARRTPLIRRMGAHLFMLAHKVGPPVAPAPPPGVWPGPFSDGSVIRPA